MAVEPKALEQRQPAICVPFHVPSIGEEEIAEVVETLRSNGYEAIGIDPEAPDEARYQRIEFERAELSQQVDAVIASTSLHHVANPAAVIDRITSTLTSGGAVLVVEWAWEKFDQETAEWCFKRLAPDDEAGWLHRRRDEWLASGRDWQTYLRDWAEREGLHPGEALVRLLDERLERHLLTHGPYFFPDLAATAEADEQAARALHVARRAAVAQGLRGRSAFAAPVAAGMSSSRSHQNGRARLIANPRPSAMVRRRRSALRPPEEATTVPRAAACIQYNIAS